MAILIPRKNITILDPPRVFLVRDDFTDNLVAGTVNGTVATPGPGTRTVVDTDGDALSITGGVASFANPNSVGGDPGLWYGSQARAAGLALITSVNIAATGVFAQWGFDSNQSGYLADCLLSVAGSTKIRPETATYIGVFAANTDYTLAVILRVAGGLQVIKGGAYTDWTLLWVSSVEVNDPVCPGEESYNATYTVDFVRVMQLGSPWSDTYAVALAFATFTDDNGTALSAYTPEVGPIAGGGANWDIQTNKARNSPTAGTAIIGGDTLNGNMETGDPPTGWSAGGGTVIDGVADERTGGMGSQSLDVARAGSNYPSSGRSCTTVVGTWYLFTAWKRNVDSTGGISLQLSDDSTGAWFSGDAFSAVTDWAQVIAVARAEGTAAQVVFDVDATGDPNGVSGRGDDVILAPLTLSDLISGADYGYSDVLVNADLAVTASTQAGVVACLDSLATPANFLLAYHDGTNAHLEKCVAGTYTSLISTAATYAANAPIRIIKDGTSVDLFYNNAKIGTTQTVSDAGIISNTIHGTFSTYVDNRVDNFEVWPRDIDGYARRELEKYAR